MQYSRKRYTRWIYYQRFSSAPSLWVQHQSLTLWPNLNALFSNSMIMEFPLSPWKCRECPERFNVTGKVKNIQILVNVYFYNVSIFKDVVWSHSLALVLCWRAPDSGVLEFSLELFVDSACSLMDSGLGLHRNRGVSHFFSWRFGVHPDNVQSAIYEFSYLF